MRIGRFILSKAQARGVGDDKAGVTAGLSESPCAPLAPTEVAAKRKGSSRSVLVGLMAPAVAAVLLAFSVPASPVQAQTAGRVEQTVVAAPSDQLDSAFAELLAADANQDGKLNGRRWNNETSGLSPLASRVFELIDYLNPRGTISFWGPVSRGDVMVGGLGTGFTLRPEHMSAQSILTREDLEQGMRIIRARIDGADQPRFDRPALMRDLAEIAEKSGADLGDIARVTDAVLDKIMDLTEAKERRLSQSVVSLSMDELSAALAPGSLEKQIVEVALSGERAHHFFAHQLRLMPSVARNYRADQVGDVQTHYLMALVKAATEESMLDGIRAEL